MAPIHIDWTRYTRTRMPVHYCPTCKTRRRMLAQFQDYYGWTETCLTCGERWTDGQLHDRPSFVEWLMGWPEGWSSLERTGSGYSGTA